MESLALSWVAPLEAALLLQDAVKAATAYRRVLHWAGEPAAAQLLAEVAVKNACAFKPEEEGAYPSMELKVATHWRLAVKRHSFAIGLARAMGRLPAAEMSRAPFQCLSSIAGLAAAADWLELGDTRWSLAETLIGFSALCEGQANARAPIDWPEVAGLAAEWLYPDAGVLAPTPRLAKVLAYDGLDYLMLAFTAGSSAPATTRARRSRHIGSEGEMAWTSELFSHLEAGAIAKAAAPAKASHGRMSL